MSLVWFTDANNNIKVAINPKYVSAVYSPTTGDAVGKTVINMINGSVAVEEDELFVVNSINENSGD